MFATFGAIFLGSIGFIGSAFALRAPRRSMEVGLFKAIGGADCEESNTCFYQNEVGIYARSIFRPLPGIDQRAVFIGATYIDWNQAVVVITPVPDAQYWAFTPYVWKKGDSLGDDIPPIIGPNGEVGMVIFSSMNNGVNVFDLPSAQNIAIIMTRNVQVYERERSAILSQFPNLTVAPLWVPSEVSLDTPVSYLLRAQFFQGDGLERLLNSTEGKTYKATWCNIGYTPITLVLPYGPEVVVPPGSLPLYIKPLPSCLPEFPLLPYFDEYLNDVMSQYNVKREIEVKEFHEENIGEGIRSGWDCFFNDLTCLADNPDATYIVSSNFDITDNESVVVVAVNHRVTQRCFYCNLNFYETSRSGSDGSVTPSSDQIFYNQPWTPGAGEYRIVERAYNQLPENTAPDPSTLILMRVFVVDYIPNPPPFVDNPLTLLNPNTEVSKFVASVMRCPQ